MKFPYLLLMVFTAWTIRNPDPAALRAFEPSPYDGLAVSLIDPYGANPVPELSAFRDAVAQFKELSTKNIWPVVYLNRIIGFDPTEGRSHAGSTSDVSYFRNIPGVALYDVDGPLGDFNGLFKLALRVSKELGSPGIVVDVEAYNNYKAYDINYVARKLHKTPAQVRARYEEIGDRMAQHVADTFPNAVLWFLFTEFRTMKKSTMVGHAHLVKGLLRGVKTRGLSAKILSGGESSLGYCHSSYEEMNARITARALEYRDVLAEYSPNYELAGTLALWDDPRLKRNWMTQGKCGASRVAGVEEFEPYLRSLFKAYNYVWIYAAGAAGYWPFDPEKSRRYNEVIGRSIGRR